MPYIHNPNFLTQTSLQTTSMMRFQKDVHVRIQQRRMERFQPLDRSWSHKCDMHDSWSKHTNLFFKQLYCSAICGVTKMGNRKQQ